MSVTKTIKLQNGVDIPAVGLGVYLVKNDEAEEIVYNGLKAGYRHVDSAQMYANEEGVSRGIKRWIDENPASNKREDVFFTTKILDVNHGYEKAKASLEVSLQKCSLIGYIDLVLIHSPQSDKERRLGTWKALQEFVDAGKVVSIGVSNYGVKHIEELLLWKDLLIKPVVNQIEVNPWLMRCELTEYCEKHDIKIEAYSPLTQGRKLDDPVLMAVAEKYQKDVAQILIRWSLQCGFIVLPKTSHKERLVSNLNVFDFDISAEDMGRLSHPKSYEVFASWDPVNYEK